METSSEEIRVKKRALLIFFLSFFVVIWGISFDESLERFEEWIAQPQDQSNQIFEAINDISVYRKYRLAMIGPIRDDERFYDVNKLLELVFDNIKTGDINEDLSLAAYLAYLSASLFNGDLTVGGLNSFAPYYTTYNQANTQLRDTAVQYFSHWIGYGVGIVNLPPDERFSIDPPAKALRTRLRYAFTPDSVIFPLLSSGFTPDTETSLKQAVDRVKTETAKSISDQDLDRLIKRQAQIVGSPVYTTLLPDQTEFAKAFVEKTPKVVNLWSYRFLAYGLVLLALLVIKKWRFPVLTLLIVFEAIVQYYTHGYLFSDSEAFIYGLLTFSLLSFSLILWLSRVFNKKKRGGMEWVNLSMYLAMGVLWFFPYWISPEPLRMDRQETFYQSAVYEVLKEELFEWKRGFYEEPFNDYLISREATTRYAEIIEKRLEKAMPFSGIQLRRDTESYLTSKWKSSRFQPLEPVVMQSYATQVDSDFISPDFYLFQSIEGSYALLLITLATAALIVFRPGKRFFMVLYVAAWIPFFVQLFRTDIHLLVERGYPLLPLTENHPGMFVLVLAITCFLFSVYLSWKTYQKEGKKQ